MDPDPLWTCVGRRDDYAIQQASGRYLRAFRPLTPEMLTAHLAGRATVGTYVLDKAGTCSFAVFDADQDDGLSVLAQLRAVLAAERHPSYLERSRRGGHLWLFLAEPVSASLVRAWLWPQAVARNLELFPKQAAGQGIGSLIRLPLGIHQRSGQRYPFVDEALRPVALTVPAMLAWLAQVERVSVSSIPVSEPANTASPVFSPPSSPLSVGEPPLRSIRDWNAAQDPFALIGRYVKLDPRGSGHCPFPGHHQNGRDAHVSFRVHPPRRVGGWCWYCYAWGRGGSAFDFLRYWYGLDAKTLWQRVLTGDVG